MPRTCCVPGCKSNCSISKEPHVTTFAFPKNEIIAEKWKKNIQKPTTIGKCAAVCVKHFRPQDVIREDSAVRDDGTILTVPRVYPKLKRDAVPIFCLGRDILDFDIKDEPTELIESMDTDSLETNKSLEISKPLEINKPLEVNKLLEVNNPLEVDNSLEISKPVEINKSPGIIKSAQKELSKLDVLVCGQCHDVFHYVEQFQEHRGEEGCTLPSKLRETYKCEIKPQIWAFLLWKNVQTKSKKDVEPVLTQWALYQDWSKLKVDEKEPWIAAGQNVLAFSRIGVAKLQETKNDKSKFVGSNISTNNGIEGGEKNTSPKEKLNKTNERKPIVKTTPQRAPPLLTPTITKKLSENKALRTCKNDAIVIGTIEKILNRRYNNKKKCLEYFIKWENSTDNSWEPRNHVEKCSTLLDEFDKMFNKNKKVQKMTPQVIEPPATPSLMEVDDTSTGRPQRTSKKKALNQVKVWCGDIEDGEEEFEKRKYMSDDEDSTDSFEKKIKLDDETESSEDEKPSVTIRRVMKSASSVNGIPKSLESGSLTTPPPRVVRVSQKQMPSLASGVYLMSKTDGIVKIDSNNPPGASPLLKVGQKIGQTNIKVVKGDGAKTPVKVTKSVIGTPKSATSQAQRRNLPLPKLSAVSSESKKTNESNSKAEEEESDGLEELEFPTNLPLPPPDSPPGEFTLCPLTGKVLGAKEIDEPLPENTSLENLVKEVLDLPSSSDLKEETAPVRPIISTTLVKAKLPPTIVTTSTINVAAKSTINTPTDLEMAIDHSSIARPVPRTTTPSRPNISSPETSILSKVLTNPKPQLPGPKKLLTTPHVVRTKINYSVNKPVLTKSPQTPAPTIIHKVTPNRNNRQFLSKPMSQEPTFKRTTNVTTYKPANVTRKIASNVTYKNEKPNVVKKVLTPMVTQVAQIQSPQQVISMPLLTTDDDTTNINNAVTTSISEIEPIPELPVENELDELSTYSIPDTDTPILITGEDGTIYQVAGQNEEGQTILISEGPDGTHQCVIVSSDNLTEELPALTTTDTQATTSKEEEEEEEEQMDTSFISTSQTEGETEGEGDDSQVVAQIIKADPPSPGGTRKVVLMLPDGNLMMTDVSAEQYAALELDK